MALKAAFIFLSPSADGEKDKTVIKTQEVELTTVGVADYAMAEAVAVKLAERVEDFGRYEYLVNEVAEKDLLLKLRKQEILKNKDNIAILERKANCILHQCRIWVRRTKEKIKEIQMLDDALGKSQASLETLFTKLQQYKEKDRENKILIAELKESNANKTAELQIEIVELKQKLEKNASSYKIDEKRYQEEIAALSSDLKECIEKNQNIKRELNFFHKQNSNLKKQLCEIKVAVRNPLVRMIVRLTSLFSGKTDSETPSL